MTVELLRPVRCGLPTTLAGGVAFAAAFVLAAGLIAVGVARAIGGRR